MEQKDFLLRYLEQLSKLVALLVGLKEKGKPNDGIEKVNENFKLLTGIEIGEIENLDVSAILHFITVKTQSNTAQIHSMAELLYWKGLFTSVSNAKPYFEKSLLLFEHLQNTNKVYSLEMESKITELRNTTK